MHQHLPHRTLHARIRGDIEAHIISGRWPAGHRIPLEQELMVEYACSRMTVNKAVSALVADGLVTRNRRAGSFVAKPRMHSAVLHIPDIKHEVEARGSTYSYKCLSLTAREACCEYLGTKGHDLGSSVFIRCVHFADNKPLVLEERHIFLETVPAAAGVDFKLVPPGTWLLEHVPWTEAENQISAMIATSTISKELKIKLGSACLVVQRRTWRGKDTLTHVRQIFRGDGYQVTAKFGHVGK